MMTVILRTCVSLDLQLMEVCAEYLGLCQIGFLGDMCTCISMFFKTVCKLAIVPSSEQFLTFVTTLNVAFFSSVSEHVTVTRSNSVPGVVGLKTQ